MDGRAWLYRCEMGSTGDGHFGDIQWGYEPVAPPSYLHDLGQQGQPIPEEDPSDGHRSLRGEDRDSGRDQLCTCVGRIEGVHFFADRR